MSSNIEVKLDVLNQKASPALYAASLANRPAASFTGRLFVDSDSPSTGIYRDTGTSWVQVADQGAGTTGTLQQVTTNGSTTNVGISITTISAGSVLFAGTGGLISQDNTNLFWDNTNKFLGIGPTGGPTALLDIHSASQNIFIQVNATSTNNSQIAFLNGGVGKWRIGNLYNAGANDYIIYDTVSALARLTVKNTGQTFIGTDTTSSGKLVVNSATADSQIVVIGANSPSFRIRNTGTAPTLNVGLGISTGVNNFIQSSASGDFCIFNASTTASPILFGVYDSGAGNTQEAARISAARNFLIGTTTDSGYKLNVNGTAYITSSITANSFIKISGTSSQFLKADGSVDTTSYISGNGTSTQVAFFNGTNNIVSSTNLFWDNNLGYLGVGTNTPNNFFTVAGDMTTSTSIADNNVAQLVIRGRTNFALRLALGINTTSNQGVIQASNYGTGTLPLLLNPTGSNVLIGTLTDAGYKLDVNGTGRFSGNSLRVVNGSGSADFILDRASASAGATMQYITGGTLKWYTGLRGLANNSFYIFNNATSTNTLILDESSNSATFSNSIAIGNSVAAGVAVASTHKVSILIGGVQYYLLASNV